jgi:hypothetical protein
MPMVCPHDVRAQWLDMSESTLNEFASGVGLIKSNLVGNDIGIVECRLGPNYFTIAPLSLVALA